MKFHVTPMTCGSCVRTITRALQAIDPQADVAVDLAAGTVSVRGALSSAETVAVLSAAGYNAAPAASGDAPATSGGCCGSCHA